jgi:hypothetical protein
MQAMKMNPAVVSCIFDLPGNERVHCIEFGNWLQAIARWGNERRCAVQGNLTSERDKVRLCHPIAALGVDARRSTVIQEADHPDFQRRFFDQFYFAHLFLSGQVAR